jgi:SAM-dependent methyltransferase
VLRRVIDKFRKEGMRGAIHAVRRQLRGGRIPGFSSFADEFRGCGLEVGGPSRMFSVGQHLPVYGLAERIDNCNFAGHTVWEGVIEEGYSFRFNERRSAGYQFIREATDLHGIADEAYDFLLSSHTLEHTANPIKALKEWQRVVKANGTLAIIVPHRDGTFDHRRALTPLEHMIADYENQIDETDLTHLEEILAQHDCSLDPFSGTMEEFRQRSLKNFENRCLHHHVFNARSFARLLDVAGLNVRLMSVQMPHDIIAICRKQSDANDNFLSSHAAYLSDSPFKSGFV